MVGWDVPKQEASGMKPVDRALGHVGRVHLAFALRRLDADFVDQGRGIDPSRRGKASCSVAKM